MARVRAWLRVGWIVTLLGQPLALPPRPAVGAPPIFPRPWGAFHREAPSLPSTFQSPLAPSAFESPLAPPGPAPSSFTSPLAPLMPVPSPAPPKPEPVPPPEERPVTPEQPVSFLDGRVAVEVPAALPIARLRLAVRERRPLGAGQAGIALAFDLTAADARGRGISSFAAPLTITVRLGEMANWSSRPDWLRPWVGHWDEGKGEWVAIAPIALDEAAGVVTFATDHLSLFGAGSQGVMVSGWLLNFNDTRTDRFSGALLWDYALDLPAGPGGIKPALRLAYNSRRPDGVLTWAQADGAGWGWSLDVPQVLWRNVRRCFDGANYFLCWDPLPLLVLDGEALKLVPESGALPRNVQYTGPSSPLRFRTEDERFWRVVWNPGPENGWWEVTLKDGTRLRLGTTPDSRQRLRGAIGPWTGSGWLTNHATVRWRVKEILAPTGVAVVFTYAEQTLAQQCDLFRAAGLIGANEGCFGDDPHSERASYLAQIEYPGTRVRLVWDRRWNGNGPNDGFDAVAYRWDFAQAGMAAIFWQTDALQAVVLERQRSNGAWEAVRKWSFTYGTFVPEDGTNKRLRVLTALQEQALEGSTWKSLPPFTFGYGGYANKDFCFECAEEWKRARFFYPRLTRIDNGYGGVIEAGYETPDGGWWQAKNYRVAWRKVHDGQGGGGQEAYAYSGDNRGRCYLHNEDTPRCKWPDSFPGPSGGLFLGYREVTVTFQDLGGNPQRREWNRFALPEGPTNDPWPARGRLREQRVYAPDGSLRQALALTYGISPTLGGANFVFLQRQDLTTDGRTVRTEWRYDPYGNPTAVLEHGFLDAWGDERTTHRGYAVNPSAWIVDRVAWERVYEGISGDVGGAALVTERRFFYDGASSFTAPPTKGLLTRVDQGRGDWGWVREQAGYDAWGNPTVITDARGFATTFGYDPTGVYRLWSRNPLGHLTRYEHYGINEGDPGVGGGPVGALKRVVDPNGAAEVYTYDGFGRLRKIVRPGDSENLPTVEYRYADGYAANGLRGLRVLEIRRERSGCGGCVQPILRFYDGLGRLVQERMEKEDGAVQIVRNWVYDALGRLIREDLPAEEAFTWDFVRPAGWEGRPHTRTAYDPLGRPTAVTAPDGSVTRYAYGDGGTLALDPNGHQVLKCSDGLGRLAEVYTFRGVYGAPTWAAPPLAVARYRHNALDRLTDVRDPLGNRIRIAYDPLGRKVRLADPAMGTWFYRYDAAGNLIAQVDGRGVAVNFYYDPLNRLVGKSYTFGVGDGANYTPPPDPGPGGYAVGYAYDEAGHGAARGRRTRAWTAEGIQRTWAYDERGRVTRATLTVEGQTYVQTFAYDAADRLVQRGDPDGEVLTYSYGAHGWPVRLAGREVYAGGATYNAAGQRVALTLWGGGPLRRTYDPRTLRVVRIQGPGLDLGYAYDRVGNVTRITDTLAGEVWAFTYDELDRLVGMSGPLAGAWSLDEGGRWLVRTEGSRTWAYDYGDPSPGPYRVYLPLVLTASAAPVRCFAGAWAAAWGGADAGRSWRLVGASDGTVLGYDPNGNVLTRAVGGEQWRYVYDAENRLAEVWRGSTLLARYRYDPDGERVVREVEGRKTVAVDDGYEVTPAGVRKTYRLGGEIVAVREGGAVGAVVGDHLGSVRVLAQGNTPTAAARYHPYGGIRAQSGPWPTDRRYTGQRWEGVLGLYDYRARFYDPALGRFLQPDPIVPEPGNPQALNRYAYVTNNPLRYTDPSGHWVETVWDIVSIGWDVYEVYRDPGNVWNWVALAADVGAVVLPGVPAVAGVVARGGKAAKAAVEVASHADEVVDAGRAVAEIAGRADEVADVARAVAGTTPAAVRRLYDQGVLRDIIMSAGEWENILRGVRQEAGLEVHHLIEKRFAEQLGLRSKDIPSVVLDRTFHQQKVTASLFRALPTYPKQGYTAQQIWNVYKIVYGAGEEGLKRLDWLEAIWPYFERLGVQR